MPFGFLAVKACPSDGKRNSCSNSARRPCVGPHWAFCSGIRLPELTGVCVFLVCDRAPKQKSKEELDREARPGVQTEMDEGDEKVMTEFLLLNFNKVPI